MKRIGTRIVALLVVCIIVFFVNKSSQNHDVNTEQSFTPVPVSPVLTPVITNIPTGALRKTNAVVTHPGLDRRSKKDLSQEDKERFKVKFEQRLKPALNKWCDAYKGHLPFAPERITPDNLDGFMSNGRGNSIYSFNVDGTVVSVQDGEAGPKMLYVSTSKALSLSQLPSGEVIKTEMPVKVAEVIKMLKSDSGRDYDPAQVRVMPTAGGSAMNGGANVIVGGDPLNAASWHYNIVFGPDGKITYYMKEAFK